MKVLNALLGTFIFISMVSGFTIAFSIIAGDINVARRALAVFVISLLFTWALHGETV